MKRGDLLQTRLAMYRHLDESLEPSTRAAIFITSGQVLADGMVLSREPPGSGGVGSRRSGPGSNRLSRSEPALFYFEVYGADSGSIRVQVRLLDRQSRIAHWNSSLMKLPAPSDPNNSSELSGASMLPISSLAPGSYQLEVTAEGPSGKKASRSVTLELQ